jgi:hypothetical protein
MGPPPPSEPRRPAELEVPDRSVRGPNLPDGLAFRFRGRGDSSPDRQAATAANGADAAAPELPPRRFARVDFVGVQAAPHTDRNEESRRRNPSANPFVAHLPTGDDLREAVRRPTFTSRPIRLCYRCRSRPAAPQLSHRLDFVDDPIFDGAWREGPVPSMVELIMMARAVSHQFIRLGYEGMMLDSEIRPFSRLPWIRRLRAVNDMFRWLVDRAVVESRRTHPDDLELLIGYFRLIVETKRAANLGEALAE